MQTSTVPAEMPEVLTCIIRIGRPVKYKHGDVMGSWTLMRYMGNGDWEAECVCGCVRSGKPVHFFKSCRVCTALRRGATAPAHKPHAHKRPDYQASRDRYRPSLSDIRKAVCRRFGMGVTDIFKASRERKTAWPRQMAMLLAREMTDNSYPYIGRQFGKSDHTTVMHACLATRRRIASDPAWAAHYNALRLELNVREQIEIEAAQ